MQGLKKFPCSILSRQAKALVLGPETPHQLSWVSSPGSAPYTTDSSYIMVGATSEG